MLRRAALACCLALLAACDDGGAGGAASVANVEWHRQDLNAQISRWQAIAPTPSGLMLGEFDRNWKPTANGAGDLTLHSRVVYTMLVGYEASGDQRYLEAARRGTDFMLEHFRDREFGGFYQRVDATGKVIGAHKNAYGHAFALLALSHAARVTGEAKYKEAALAAWRDIRDKLREPGGGLRMGGPRDFMTGPSKGYSQNHLMHMFEAQLALIEATGDQSVVADARELGDFVLNKLMQGLPTGGAYIPEWYDGNWQPLKDGNGYIDIGHQFEWSHLLRTAERRGLPPIYTDVADRLLKYAVANGYDEQDGGIYARVYANGEVDRRKLWWPQAEAMRAFLAVPERPDMVRRYQETQELVDKEFLDHEHGGWLIGARKNCSTADCSKLQPDPYHLVGLHWTVLSTKQ
ncbi:AGE family epimerase/isomerase [Pseudoduganella sp. OTU4001]|uniref:AGE family epimerase/isomerase n=1 Tax=Pseudoduganella sp. OTU4001 TaxID=3043854 RepID=UPI00313DC682